MAKLLEHLVPNISEEHCARVAHVLRSTCGEDGATLANVLMEEASAEVPALPEPGETQPAKKRTRRKQSA